MTGWTQKYGRQQSKILQDMARYGNNTWPPHWRLGYDKRRILENLRAKGAVTLVPHSSGVMVYRIAGTCQTPLPNSAT